MCKRPLRERENINQRAHTIIFHVYDDYYHLSIQVKKDTENKLNKCLFI